MPLTDQECELLKVHLPYELDLLDYAFVHADCRSSMVKEGLYQLMAIDCFYMHARNLIKFYEGSKAKAEGRTSAASKFTRDTVSYPSFGEYEKYINDQVAHLNWDRGSHAKELLDGKALAEIRNLLAECLERFQDNLTDDAKTVWKRRTQRAYHLTGNTFNAARTNIYENIASTADIQQLIDHDFLSLSPHGGDTVPLWLPPPKRSPQSNN